MEIELLEKAASIHSEIVSLENKMKRLSANASPKSYLSITVNQCYGDMGLTYQNKEEFSGDVADEIYDAIISVIETKIALLKNELEKL